MLTVIAAIHWGEVGIAVASAVGLSGLLSAALDAYFTARLRRNELREVWRRDRLTAAVTEYLPVAASMVELTRTAHYAWHEPGDGTPSAARPEFGKAADECRARMAEVQRLEIPVLLFIGKEHRAAVAAYTWHLDHGLWASIEAPLNAFGQAVEETERLQASMEEAVRADFDIP